MDDPSAQGHALNGNSVTHHVFLEVNGDNISNNGMETKDGMSPDLISPAGQSLPASTWASGGDFCASEAFLAQVSNERKEVHGQKLNLPKVSEKPGSVRRVEQQVKEEVFAGTLAASSTRRGSPRLMMTKTVPLVAEFTPAPPKEAVSSPASTKTLVAALSPPLNQALTPASKQFNMTFAPQSSSRTFKRTGRARSTESPRAMSPEERGIQDIPSISGNVHKRSAKEVDDDDGEYSERESTPSSKRAKTSKSSMSKEQERRASKRISTGIIVISQDESTKTNNDYCDTCKGLGRFLCCDSCPRAFHFSCVEPPIDIGDLEKMENWYCNVCRCEKKPPLKPPKGLFEKLIDNVNRMNPHSFELPKEVRDFFKGVTSNKQGEYVDAGEIKTIRYGKNGLAEEPDYARLKDKNGRVILCYKCGKSALKGPIIPCDHCTLYWHMDCLDPPMTNPPSQLKKWMCPNHVEHALPKKRKRKDTVIVDPQDPYNVPNDGNIEVVNEPEETETEGEEEKTWQRGRLEELSYGGVTYRLPERAIKLNFMESIRSIREQKLSRRNSSHSVPSPTPSSASTVLETIAIRASSTLRPNGPMVASTSLTISPLSSPSSSISSMEFSTPSRSRLANKPSREGASLHDHNLHTVKENEQEHLRRLPMVTDGELEQWLGGLSALQRDMANNPRVKSSEDRNGDEPKGHTFEDNSLRLLLRAAMCEQVIEMEQKDHPIVEASLIDNVTDRCPESIKGRDGRHQEKLSTGTLSSQAPTISEDDPRYKQFLAVQSLMRVKGEEALMAFLMGP